MKGVHTSSFGIVDINPLQLHVISTLVPIKGYAGQLTAHKSQEYKCVQAIPFDTVLVREDLPEFGTWSSRRVSANSMYRSLDHGGEDGRV